ncbi:unnamed protein product [Enterobius vermicularis]|uniref:phosphorylase kinase n=1 Tax=Enterobius vermicularis TaxID=51028 RepID=A0A0N4V1D4_ENTVE|nr:unnamed protein product [Enterobius vermicularis]
MLSKLLRQILGRGLASTVRKCVEKGTGQVFAVKIVDVSTERQSQNEAERLLNETISEVNLLRQLADHPSIISIHDFYQAPTFLFAVFEMAPRGELFELLNKSVTVSEKKARRLMRQLFDGVAFMHEKLIVHRDLKLENILCIDEERIIISDFGFATQLKPGQRLTELLGTPGYLAPEILRCQMYEDTDGYGLEVDDWALGVILYTLLAGYAPFYNRRQLIMLRMIQEAKYDLHSEQWSHITDEAKDLIKNIFVVDVSKRFNALQCLQHPWMVGVSKEIAAEAVKKRDFRRIWRRSIHLARFFIRLTNIKNLKVLVDRDLLKQRPFRDREIRHLSEAAVFSVYGHWVNRGYYYSRDLLFANRPRPRYQNPEVQMVAA